LKKTTYVTARRSGGTAYLCPSCTFSFFRGLGNDEGAHDRAVAAIERHVAESHVARAPEVAS